MLTQDNTDKQKAELYCCCFVLVCLGFDNVCFNLLNVLVWLMTRHQGVYVDCANTNVLSKLHSAKGNDAKSKQ